MIYDVLLVTGEYTRSYTYGVHLAGDRLPSIEHL